MPLGASLSLSRTSGHPLVFFVFTAAVASHLSDTTARVCLNRAARAALKLASLPPSPALLGGSYCTSIPFLLHQRPRFCFLSAMRNETNSKKLPDIGMETRSMWVSGSPTSYLIWSTRWTAALTDNYVRHPS
ncbi:hypothetical protein QBC32DRAFT_333904 [Pseudoneurospora amorphoporcata]|uniref:Uncharacterized protein n=1 Tax=Pseudoneurospora amorphoporcata TaxID=241081 RepID=A0AAN6P0B5_9PEZI|nr:hypothetical protein QBC32DRAFT_333904 [Pseudoneurospora amorphoporcata]